jgi:spore germination protein GerM
LSGRALKIAVAIMLAAVIATSVYVYVLQQREEERARRVAYTQPVSPPVAGPAERVPLYIAYDFEGVLRPREVQVALPVEHSQRARAVLHALLGEYTGHPSPHELAPGADVRAVFLVSDNLAVVDTNAAFADGHRSGVFVEMLTVASVVKTLAANLPGITRVKILVEGKERETLAGHADLMTFYDVSRIDELVKQLE